MKTTSAYYGSVYAWESFNFFLFIIGVVVVALLLSYWEDK